jgi:hypothetical protein
MGQHHYHHFIDQRSRMMEMSYLNEKLQIKSCVIGGGGRGTSLGIKCIIVSWNQHSVGTQSISNSRSCLLNPIGAIHHSLCVFHRLNCRYVSKMHPTVALACRELLTKIVGLDFWQPPLWEQPEIVFIILIIKEKKKDLLLHILGENHQHYDSYTDVLCFSIWRLRI